MGLFFAQTGKLILRNLFSFVKLNIVLLYLIGIFDFHSNFSSAINSRHINISKSTLEKYNEEAKLHDKA